MASRKKNRPDAKRLAKIRMARRRQIVAMLYLAGGHTERSIAEHLQQYGLGCTIATVSRDLKALKQGWMDSANQTTTQWQIRELGKLGFLEEVLLTHLTHGAIEAGKYADVMTKILKRRSELLGLDAPKQVAITDHRDPHKVSLLTDEELERVIATAYEIEGIKPPPMLEGKLSGKVQ
jgi:hypothetical protein